MNLTDTPQVWIACLASYNAGRLIGEWVDATDVDEMNEARDRVAKAAVAAAKEAGEYPVYFGEPEEFAIHDYNNFPTAVVSSLGEYPNWERVATIGRLLEEDSAKFAAWLEFTDDLDSIDADEIENLCNEQCVASGVESEEDYARDYVIDSGGGWAGVPSVVTIDNAWERKEIRVFEELSSYINWETIARALFRHGTLTLVNGYVFDSER